MNNQELDAVKAQVAELFPGLSKTKASQVGRRVHGFGGGMEIADRELRAILRHKTIGYDQLLAMGIPYEPLKKLITEIENLCINHFLKP